MRFHVPHLPHASSNNDDYSWRAYVTVVNNFAKMMRARGHVVDIYFSSECFADGWIDWDYTTPVWTDAARDIIDQMTLNVDPEDIICLVSSSQYPIAQAFPNNIAVEFAIGYPYVLAPYRVWQSYAWMHHYYGTNAQHGANYDAVIPNYFDVGQFPLGDGSGGYLLYVGRLTPLKGIDTVAAIQKATGLELLVVGQGEYLPDCEHEYLGVVSDSEKTALMGNALAVLSPTQYVEPFGNVAVEAQLCGTPVLTTDWGGFTETCPPRWRCRTLADYLYALERVSMEWRTVIRSSAQSSFGLDTVALQYERYFERLQTLHADGWYTREKQWQATVPVNLK